jgi:DNA-binding transcriptional MerR regulator/methylmalonyl-CoA mutase cobalamin-binding subunit
MWPRRAGEDLILTTTIADVERETGLSKDVLRVWERRYGFPKPERDAAGERVYGADQVGKLRVIRRLIDLGMRPGKIVNAPMTELAAHLAAPDGRGEREGRACAERSEALALIGSGEGRDLGAFLRVALSRMGLKPFLEELAGPLAVHVGEAWADGRLEIHQEHLFSEQLQNVLRQAIASTAAPARGPRVLLTTMPGERHQLGLLMAEAYMTLDGARCIALGVETPPSEIARAASAHGADVVGLSFSSVIRPKAARRMVEELRAVLAPAVSIWLGGATSLGREGDAAGVLVLRELADITAAIDAWRARRVQP